MCCVEARSPLPWGQILFQSAVLQRAVFSGSHEPRCYWSGMLSQNCSYWQQHFIWENRKRLSFSFTSEIREEEGRPLPILFSTKSLFQQHPFLIREMLSFSAKCCLFPTVRKSEALGGTADLGGTWIEREQMEVLMAERSHTGDGPKTISRRHPGGLGQGL